MKSETGDDDQDRDRAAALSLCTNMVFRTSWASAAAGAASPADGVTGRERDRGPCGGIAQEGRNGRRGRSRCQDRAQRDGGQGHAAARQGGPESAGADKAALHRPGRASEALGGLVDRQALEVAEDHRQAEGFGQAVNLVVEGLGLLAVDRRPVGRAAGAAAGPLME